MRESNGSDPILTVEDLSVQFPGRGFRAEPIVVINGVSFVLHRGETMGMVGESGSGKTTIGRAILGLAPVSGGTITFDGAVVSNVKRKQRRRLTDGIQVIFQDPYSSLNPSMTIEQIVREPLAARGSKVSAELIKKLLDAVHLPQDAGQRLPREFSGGQRQRIAIARALALNPALIVCDEPTSALDTTTQSRVIGLLREIQEQTDVAYLFISHDLTLVHEFSDHIAVLLDGRIVESGESEDLMRQAQHPYTKRLQMATPVPNPVLQEERRRARLALLAEQEEDLQHHVPLD